MAFPLNNAKLSPMMRQYLEIKKKHMDELLFYRLGDFYELFFDDAVTASRELELVLTGRDCGLDERAPMCGVPFHSYEGYVAKLIAKGYRVAICEQMEDPALAKGIVRRQIIRVVTPGTVTEKSMLSEEANNYVACVFADKTGFGMSFCDISTGVVYVTEAAHLPGAVINELSRFEPREFLCNSFCANEKKVRDYISKGLGTKPYILYDNYFDANEASGAVISRFGNEKATALGQFSLGNAVRSLGALLKYLTQTQFNGVERLIGLEPYVCAQYMLLPASTRRNLELSSSMRTAERRGSLLWVIDKTKSAMGKRLLRAFLDKPLIEPQSINRRLDACEELYENTVDCERMRDSLKGIIDIERLMTRVLYRTCTPRDLAAFAASCELITQLRSTSSRLTSELNREISDRLDDLSDLRERIGLTISDDPPALLKDGGYIRQGFDAQADELRELVKNSRAYLARMESGLREKTGIKNLRVGYNKVFGYYIEVSKGSVQNVPEGFIRKQTLTTGERYITEELKELESKILSASERLNTLERGIFEQLLAFIETQIPRVQECCAALAYLDVLCSYAANARASGYCKPVVDEGGRIEIQGGRHPVVEQVSDELFVPNDTLLDEDANEINIITGPNMAGKSTYMRQTALIVLLAQMGSFVPAQSAHIGVVDAIFTRVGASDDLFSGDSTFMVEMKEVAEILNGATKKSLVVLDEIGRGTSTYDGMSIAKAVVEHISAKIGAKTMFATHYHELTVMANEDTKIKNYNIAVKKRGDEITFLRRIVKGPADESYGIEVAKLAGLPDSTIERAKQVLKNIEEKNPVQVVCQVTDVGESKAKDAVFAAVGEVNVECLTPIEAMCVLNDIKKLYDAAEREYADSCS